MKTLVKAMARGPGVCVWGGAGAGEGEREWVVVAIASWVLDYWNIGVPSLGSRYCDAKGALVHE